MKKNKNIVALPPPDRHLDRLSELIAEHRKLYEAFLPTLNTYQDMAKRALELQVEIFNHRFAQAFPEAAATSRSLVTSITARETPQHLEKLLAEFERQDIKITEIVYDPRTFVFHLFSSNV